MGCGTSSIFYSGPSNLILGGNAASAELLAFASKKIDMANRSSTATVDATHFKTFLAYFYDSAS